MSNGQRLNFTLELLQSPNANGNIKMGWGKLLSHVFMGLIYLYEKNTAPQQWVNRTDKLTSYFGVSQTSLFS